MDQKQRDKIRRQRSARAAAFLLIGMLALFGVLNLAVSDREFSEKENRILEERPKLTVSGLESGRFMEQYESYLEDQFAGRDLWVSLRTDVSLLLGKRESNGVFKGKDHYLLEKISRPDEERLRENLEAMNAFASRSDASYYMMLAPNAASILSDKLPALAETEDQRVQFQKIQEILGESMTWVDAWEALSEHKDEAIYYHTDHHWTTLGAYYAFQKLAAAMGLDLFRIADYKPYAVTDDFNGTLSASSGYESGYREPIYIYAPENPGADVKVVVNYTEEQKKTAALYDSSKLEERDKYALFLGGNFGMIDIRTTSDRTERLLLIKDSYANCMISFLAPYFREIVVLDPRYYYGDIDKVMSEKQITDVLFLYNGNTFADDNSISGVLTPESS